MKTVIIGDIHGRPFWRDIIEKENPDKVIFLGDFVTTHELYTGKDQLEQLIGILEFKEANWDKCVILRGNHDTQALGYYWARCFPLVPAEVTEWFSSIANKERFLKASQWCHVIEVNGRRAICSHAGVSYEWLKNEVRVDKFDEEYINSLEPSEKFGFTGGRFDNYGTDPRQSLTWIRPQTLVWNAVMGYDQIVGHTGTYQGCIRIDIHDPITEVPSGWVLWQCDALQQKAYLVIENNEYYPRFL